MSVLRESDQLNYIMQILTFYQGLFKHVKTKVIALCRFAISVKEGKVINKLPSTSTSNNKLASTSTLNFGYDL